MISKAMQQVTAPLAQRIQDATDSITNAVGGYAALIDRDGDGVSDALYIGEYPAAEGKTKGRCLLLNKNGMAVSTTGLQGPLRTLRCTTTKNQPVLPECYGHFSR